MKIFFRIFTAVVCAVLVFSFTGCGANNENNIIFDDEGKPIVIGKTTITFWAAVDANNKPVYDSLVKKFNSENGYKIEVKLIPKPAGYVSSLGSTLQSSTPPDVVQIDDKYVKTYAVSGLLEPLDSYLNNDNYIEHDENGNPLLNLSDIWPDTIRRFRYDKDTYKVTDDAPLFGLPQANCPTVLFYNASLFKSKGINIISVAEEDLADFNLSNGTSYLPHGYYEYTANPAPFASPALTATGGKYRVFNNLISLNFEEIVQLGKLFTKSYDAGSLSDYGFFTEWWFSHGWSVGGDCIEWIDDPNGDGDVSDGQYMFTLGDKLPNYLVTGGDVNVNGTVYAAGDILSYKDKKYVAEVKAGLKTDAEILSLLANNGTGTGGKSLYTLPSQYDAFEEFCRLSQTKDKTVNPGVYGYGVSPNPNTINQDGKQLYFTSQKTAMLVVEMQAAFNINRSVGTRFEWDVAPLPQWREYNVDGTLKVVNGTRVVGRRAGHNYVKAWAIPSKSKAKFAAFKFIEYMTSLEAQKALAQTGEGVPNQISYANSSSYLNEASAMPRNRRAIIDACYYSTEGDWCYLEDGEWIDPWANILNGPVRNGTMTIDAFFSQVTGQTNLALAKYRSKG